jgi:hypothetical protein
MDFEYNIPEFYEWIGLAGLRLVISIVLLAFGGWIFGFLISAARRGPVEGFYAVWKTVFSGTLDLANTSVRRTLAMSMLAIQEAVRRKVLVAFAVFVVVILFAGWFLDVKSDDPAKLYLSFVLTASNYLVLILALFLSAFSIPTDMKNKTIYTIVTKPVRAYEIVLGRIIGFSLIGTVILGAMCIVSYFFVVRGLSHRHTVESFQTTQAAGGQAMVTGETTLNNHHRHTFELDADGEGETNLFMGHKHYVRRTGNGADAPIEIGPPVEMLQARNPIYGNLSFLDRTGKPTQTGVNVGHEWLYRSYIEGGTEASAIWSYSGVTADRFENGFDIEMNIRAFRTHKGNIERGVRGKLFLKNPDPNAHFRRSEDIPFVSKEFLTDRHQIPRRIKAEDSTGKMDEVDVFDALTQDGNIQVHIQCTDPGQYLGMARPDMYVLDAEGSFLVNFIKGYIGIWLQMVLATTFGVMFSTFLSGPVALMATLSSIVVGFFGDFIRRVTLSTIQPESLEAAQGGGPLEAFYRLIAQANLQSEMEMPLWTSRVIKGFDWVFMNLMELSTRILPNYLDFSTADYVAHGFNIAPGVMSMMLLRTLAYFCVVSLIGFFFLKTREVAST